MLKRKLTCLGCCLVISTMGLIAQPKTWGLSFQVHSISPEYAFQVKRRLFSTPKLAAELQLGAAILAGTWMLSGQGSLLYGKGPHRMLGGLLAGPWVQPEIMGGGKDWFLYLFPHLGYQFNPADTPLWIRVGTGPSWLDDATRRQWWAPGAEYKWAFFLQIGYGLGK